LSVPVRLDALLFLVRGIVRDIIKYMYYRNER